MDEFEASERGIKEFERIYCDILARLEKEAESDLSLRSKGVIIKQMECVTKRLAEKRERITRKVGDIMGGRVLKMEWLERFDAAMASSAAEGEARGKNRHLISQICRKLRKGKEVRQIAYEVEEEESIVKSVCDIAAGFAPDFDEEKVIEAVEQSKAEEESEKSEGSDAVKVTA